MRTLLRTSLVVLVVASATPAFATWPADPAVNVPLCTATNGQQFPIATSDGAGGAIVAWWDLRGGANFDVYAQRVLASGAPDPAWPANGRALCAWNGDQQYPAIASDGAGGAIVAWCDARAGLFDLYAQHVLASGALDPAWPAGGRAVCALPGGQWYPELVSDGAGGALVAWADTRGGAADVYAQRVLANGTLDPAWPAGGRAVCTAPGEQEEVQLVADGAGGALVVWADARGGVNFDVYAQHVLASGGLDPAWPANGRALSAAPSNQRHPRVVGDGAGGAVVAWQDARSGTEYDVYAQRVLASGQLAPGWPADGLALCTAALDQSEPRLVADGAGGALVAWTDGRNGPDTDIAVQHALASGAADPAWPAQGRVVCAAAEFQHSPDLVADGAGGAVVVWADSRGGIHTDLYAQHVLASGAADPAWPVDGRAVSTAPGEQANPVLVPGAPGAGSAPIVAWDDMRSGNFDIYAQLATPAVPPGTSEPAIVSVRDVRPDQGGFVTVAWNASGLDVAPALAITGYRLWRDTGSGWQPVGALAASAQAAYALVAPTTGDSTAAGVPLQRFRVEARGDTLLPAQGWFSAPDSGWSTDDLAPEAPTGFDGEYAAGTATLYWSANAEPDLAGYRLYRGLSAAFEPGPATFVAQVVATAHADPAGAPYAYKLAAVDAHGNESAPALFLPGGTAGIGAGVSRPFLALAGPHPARGVVALRFGLPVPGHAVLALYDAGGRRVRVLVEGDLSAGEHAVAWDGRDDRGGPAAAGLYFARLETRAGTRTLRVARFR